MTTAHAHIISEMQRLADSLKEKDLRRRVLRGEINRHHLLRETQRKVASLLSELKAHNVEPASLDEAASREALPVQQSLAWARWHRRSRRLEDEIRKILTGGREHCVVIHDGKGTRHAFDKALARFERTRAAYGEPDDSARLERLRKEDEDCRRTQLRRRGGRLSMCDPGSIPVCRRARCAPERRRPCARRSRRRTGGRDSVRERPGGP